MSDFMLFESHEQMQTIRVLLANHHPIIRSTLRHLLECDAEIKVTAEAANGEEALRLTQFQSPDVVLLEFQLPILSGIATARQINGWQRGIGMIFINATSDEEYAAEAFKAGARGFVLDSAAQEDLGAAIRVVSAGGVFLSRGIRAEFSHGWPETESSVRFTPSG